MYRLAFFLLAVFFSSNVHCMGSQQLIFSYYDRQTYEEQSKNLSMSSALLNETEMEKGALVLYQRILSQPAQIISMYGGVDVGRWDFPGERAYTYSSFFASRFWGLSILGFRPYIEVSLGGPTYISKRELAGVQFHSNFIFQHYLAVGLEFFTFTVDVRTIRYGKDFVDGLTMPVIGSLGFNF